MPKDKFVKGHLMEKGNFRSIDGNHSITFDMNNFEAPSFRLIKNNY